MILFPGSNSRCPRCDLPCRFVDLFHWKDVPFMLARHILSTLLCFCLGCKYAGCLLSLLISTLYTVCNSYLFLYIEIRNREVRVIGAYRHTTCDNFSFFFSFNPLYYKHHCVPCKYVLFSFNSDKALLNINNLFAHSLPLIYQLSCLFVFLSRVHNIFQ